MANSAFHPSGVGKWVPASAGKAKAGMVHSVSGWTRGVQVKLWDPLRTRAIPERLRDVITTRRCINPRLPLPLLLLLLIIINKVLIKVTLNKVIAGALYIVICGWNAVKVLGWQLTVTTLPYTQEQTLSQETSGQNTKLEVGMVHSNSPPPLPVVVRLSLAL